MAALHGDHIARQAYEPLDKQGVIGQADVDRRAKTDLCFSEAVREADDHHVAVLQPSQQHLGLGDQHDLFISQGGIHAVAVHTHGFKHKIAHGHRDGHRGQQGQHPAEDLLPHCLFLLLFLALFARGLIALCLHGLMFPGEGFLALRFIHCSGCLLLLPAWGPGPA